MVDLEVHINVGCKITIVQRDRRTAEFAITPKMYVIFVHLYTDKIPYRWINVPGQNEFLGSRKAHSMSCSLRQSAGSMLGEVVK